MCISPIYLKNRGYRGRVGEYLCYSLPCGKCAECLSRRIEDWITRLKEELKSSTFASFLTLTYNDDNLPDDNLPSKKDVQLFHRYLRRKHLEFKYFTVSENGERNGRIHYHGIYFFKANYANLYDILHDTWNKGFIYLGQANGKTIRYVTKYILKDYAGTNQNFYLMSKNLGIGYIDRMLEWHRSDVYNRSYYPDGPFKKHLPRYYRDRIFTDYEKSIINRIADMHFLTETDLSDNTEFHNELDSRLEKQRAWDRKIANHRAKKQGKL